jgi:hypothetical protein
MNTALVSAARPVDIRGSNFDSAARPVNLITTGGCQFDATYVVKPLTVLHGLLTNQLCRCSESCVTQVETRHLRVSKKTTTTTTTPATRARQRKAKQRKKAVWGD